MFIPRRLETKGGGFAGKLLPVFLNRQLVKFIYFHLRNSYTANEGPVRIQYKCLVPMYVFAEMKLLFPKQNLIIMFCLPVPTLLKSYIVLHFPALSDLNSAVLSFLYPPALSWQSCTYLHFSATLSCIVLLSPVLSFAVLVHSPHSPSPFFIL